MNSTIHILSLVLLFCFGLTLNHIPVWASVILGLVSLLFLLIDCRNYLRSRS